MATRTSKSTVINININDGEDILDMLGRGLQPTRQTVPYIQDFIEVKAGSGLTFDDDARLVISTGSGIVVTPENELSVNVGPGLDIADGQVIVDVESLIGAGLHLTPEGKIATGDAELAGFGLLTNIERSQLSVNTPELAGQGLFTHAGTGALGVSLGDGLSTDEEGRICVLTSEIGADLAGGGLEMSNGRLAVKLTGQSSVFKALTDVSLSIQGDNLLLHKVSTDFIVRQNDHGVLTGFEQGDSTSTTEIVTLPDGYSAAAVSLLSKSQRSESDTSPNFYK